MDMNKTVASLGGSKHGREFLKKENVKVFNRGDRESIDPREGIKMVNAAESHGINRSKEVEGR